MFVYFILIAYHVALWILAQRIKLTKKVKFFLSLAFVLPLIFISSFKSINVGIDTEQYYDIYKRALSLNKDYIETGFLYYTKFLRLMNAPFSIYLLVTYSIIYLSVFFFSYSKTEKPIDFLIIFTYFGFFGFALSALRQALAIGIALIGFCLFKKERIWTAIFAVLSSLIALTIHKSSFVFFFFIILSYIKISKLAFYYTCLGILFISFLSTPLYSLIYETFSSNVTYAPVVSSTFFTLIIYFTLLLLMCLMRTRWFQNINSRFFSKYDNAKLVRFFKNSEVLSESIEVDYSKLLFILFPILILTFGVNSPIIARFVYCAAPFAFMVLVSDTKYLRSKTSLVIFGVSLVFFSVMYFVFASLVKDPLTVANYQFGFII